MTTFYLVRHGQTDRRIDPVDPPLSVQGRAEAERVAAYLRPRAIAQIYASPLRRAQETAVPLTAALGLPLTIDARLRERANFGDLPGQTLEEFVALWERCSRDREYVPPVGDSSRGAGQRVEAFMAAVHATLPAGEVVAAGHGGTIADFLLNICTPATLAQIHPAFAARPYAAEIMRNGAITVVEYRGMEHSAGCYVVKEIAFTGHLPVPA
jgi:broad specificity phosphatase PhoE